MSNKVVYAIGVSASGVLALQRQYAQVQVHVPGQFTAMQNAIQNGAWLACPSAMVSAVQPQLVETAPGLFVATAN